MLIAANKSSNGHKLAGKNGDLFLRGFFKEIMVRVEKGTMTSDFHLQNVSIVLSIISPEFHAGKINISF